MFDDNKYKESDLMMRSILENGVEEVPAGVWEGVSQGLDKVSGRKRVVLMWRRAAIGMSAAAAIALGLVLNHESEDIVPSVAEGMIAVVEQDVMIAQVREEALPKSIEKKADIPVSVKEIRMERAVEDEPADPASEHVAPAAPVESVMPEEQPKEQSASPVVAERKQKKEDNLTYQYKEEYLPSEWEEEEQSGERRRRNTSIVLSGIAGTNGTSGNSRSTGLLRQPSISTAPPKTGVKETSTKSIYGIPLSFGAGVKIDLTKRWSVGAGLNYTYLTRSFYGSYTKVNEYGSVEMTMQSDIRNSQHFIGIPLNLFYDIVESDRIGFYAYAGGTVEKCLSDNYSLIDTKITHSEKVKGVQLSANLGIGVEFLIGNHLGMYIDPSVRYYFDNGQPSSIRTAQPLMLGFEMGLRVNL